MQVISATRPGVGGIPELELAQLKSAIATNLTPRVRDIDRGEYPRDFMQQVGALGAFGQAVAPEWGGSGRGLKAAIQAIEAISKECLNTGFMTWCQTACGWYLQNSENTALQQRLLPAIATGKSLGGTGLSNPMKHFAAIEKIALRAEPQKGGYRLNGTLPWVSNLGAGHPFGIAAQIEGSDDYLMAIASDALEGLTLHPCIGFIALDGSGTFRCTFRDVFIPDDWVLAAPCEEYVNRIRPGFVLTQMGMGLGLVGGCLALMEKANLRLSHVNAFLDDTADILNLELKTAQQQTYAIADEISHCSTVSLDLFRDILALRIGGSELALRAARSAMLHAGAAGYFQDSEPARRLREAYFIAIVTPALKHLKKLLHDLPSTS